MADDAWGGNRFREAHAPLRKPFEVTPDDDNDLATVTRSLFTGSGGDIAAIFADADSAVTMVDCPAGTWLPVQVKRVLATGTTATSLLGGI